VFRHPEYDARAGLVKLVTWLTNNKLNVPVAQLPVIIPGCIQKFPDGINNEIHNNSNKHSLRSNTKGYGGQTQ
jgi:hypothetical protein